VGSEIAVRLRVWVSGGVNSDLSTHWQPAFCAPCRRVLAQSQAESLMVSVSHNFHIILRHLAIEGMPKRKQKLDGLCLSY
jgi:hypothetical protein